MLGAGAGGRFPPIWTDGVDGRGEAKSRWSQAPAGGESCVFLPGLSFSSTVGWLRLRKDRPLPRRPAQRLGRLRRGGEPWGCG